MGRRQTFTKSEQQNIRANLARKASQLGNRLTKYGLGELPEDAMSANQVRAALGVLSHVLPSMVQQEVEDVTERTINREEILKRQNELRKQILKTVTPEELAGLMHPVATQEHGEARVLESRAVSLEVESPEGGGDGPPSPPLSRSAGSGRDRSN